MVNVRNDYQQATLNSAINACSRASSLTRTEALWNAYARGRTEIAKTSIGLSDDGYIIPTDGSTRKRPPSGGFLMATIHLAVNGRARMVEADPQTSLLTVLREHLERAWSFCSCTVSLGTKHARLCCNHSVTESRSYQIGRGNRTIRSLPKPHHSHVQSVLG